MSKFYVGQEVIHSDGRTGVVLAIKDPEFDSYPVNVRFNNQTRDSYTLEGFEYIHSSEDSYIKPMVAGGALLKAPLQAYAVLVAANDTNYPRCTLLKKMANDPAFMKAAEELAGKLLFALNAGRTVRRRQKQSHLLFAAAIEILFRNGVRLERVYGFQTGWGLQ